MNEISCIEGNTLLNVYCVPKLPDQEGRYGAQLSLCLWL